MKGKVIPVKIITPARILIVILAVFDVFVFFHPYFGIDLGVHFPWSPTVDYEIITPLQKAVQDGDKDKIKKLLESGADMYESQSHLISPPFNLSLELGKYDIAAYFVSKGYDVNIMPKYGEPALLDSASRCDTRAVLWLTSNGANMNLMSGRFSALEKAVEHGKCNEYICYEKCSETVKILKNNGAKASYPKK